MARVGDSIESTSLRDGEPTKKPNLSKQLPVAAVTSRGSNHYNLVRRLKQARDWDNVPTPPITVRQAESPPENRYTEDNYRKGCWVGSG